MKFRVEKLRENAVSLMRRAGYIFQHEKDGEMSFVRPLARSGFPRFHCYTRGDGMALVVSIHLDQKKETYGHDTRHHGEYENEGALKEEMAHIQKTIGEVTLLA
ncbi:MAG: hypothetical protein ABI747_02925 [Candidatus Moraniibacteriota bacterium]